MSEIFYMVHMSQVGNLAEVSRDLRDTRNFLSKTNVGKPEVLNTKVNASMSTMPSLPELPQQQNIVDMLAVGYLYVQDFRFPAICFTQEIMLRKSRETSAKIPT